MARGCEARSLVSYDSNMDLRTHIAQRIENAKKFYVKDLESSTHEFLARSPGGKARSVYDFTYEVVKVNEMFVGRLTGETIPSGLPDEGWATAPAEFCNKETCIAAVNRTMDACLEAWNALPEEKLTTPQQGENGEFTCLGIASMVATHAMYHDAQINYLQALAGDEEVHWG